MRKQHGGSYVRFTAAQSLRHAGEIKRLSLAPEVEAHFVHLAGQSIEAQQQLEAADTMPFENYRQQYLAPQRLNAVSGRRGSVRSA